MNHPFQLHYTEYTIKSMLVCTLLYAAGIGIFYSSQKNYRRGEEHGSARWGDARQICKKYSQKPYSQNILLTQNFRISLDTHKHRRCLNILVVGGSGAGKSRGFALPNIMQCCCSMVITDPKAELLRKTGGLLEKRDMRCVSLTSSIPTHLFATIHSSTFTMIKTYSVSFPI